jgi:benzoyl-CoA oxygenase B subunit
MTLELKLEREMSSIDYNEKIPNNVNLAEDRALKRALEHWQPNYIEWWQDMGPEESQDFEVYLRTAVSVDPQGWAQFGYVKMPEYRWGIFLNPAQQDRKIHFGDHKGEDAWQSVPGEYRANLRRIIVTQGDTEPASVEQQRHLGLTAPSLYDLRNLFQVNVEEGRHLWAMVYLLHKYFGRDGREEGEALLERRSGNEDNPRILQAFNEKTPDWLSFFMFTYFTDRDGMRAGRIQLRSAGAHHALHADRGGAPHVRRRVRRVAHHPAYLRSHERSEDRRPGSDSRRRRHRPADHSALHQLPFQRHHRPVRRRPVE